MIATALAVGLPYVGPGSCQAAAAARRAAINPRNRFAVASASYLRQVTRRLNRMRLATLVTSVVSPDLHS